MDMFKHAPMLPSETLALRSNTLWDVARLDRWLARCGPGVGDPRYRKKRKRFLEVLQALLILTSVCSFHMLAQWAVSLMWKTQHSKQAMALLHAERNKIMCE